MNPAADAFVMDSQESLAPAPLGLDSARRQSLYFALGFVLVNQLHTSISLRKICSVNSRSRILRNLLQQRKCGD
jgi:hypothetical protein